VKTTVRTTVMVVMVAAMLAPVPGQAEDKPSPFKVNVKKDPVTDADRSSIVTLGQEDDDMALVWRCDDDSENHAPFDVMFFFDGHIRSTSLRNDSPWVMMDIRFPPAPAEKGVWGISDARSAVFAPNSKGAKMSGAVEFTKKALKAGTVVLRVNNNPGGTPSSYTATFDITGLEAALKQLSCTAAVFGPEAGS
jgi:hypothetical protein